MEFQEGYLTKHRSYLRRKESRVYRKHPDFQLPDRDSTIWRCMTIDEFADLLESRELFFARADVLRDQREGVWSLAEVDYLLQSRAARESEYGEILEITERISDEACKSVALSCWCIGEHVPSHMWQDYLDGKDGVAIATTVEEFMAAFDRETVQPVYIGEVKYIDDDNDRMNASTSLAPFVFKGREFEGERELRAVTTRQLISPDLKLNVHEPDDFYPGATIDGDGIRISVHLDKLLKQIRIAPSASNQCVELVRRGVKTFNRAVS